MKMTDDIYESLKERHARYGSAFAAWDNSEEWTPAMYETPEIRAKLNTGYIVCSNFSFHHAKNGVGNPNFATWGKREDVDSSPYCATTKIRQAFVGSPWEGSYITHFFKRELFSEELVRQYESSGEDIDAIIRLVKKPAHRAELMTFFAEFVDECRELQNPNLVVLAINKKVVELIDFCKKEFPFISFPYRVIDVPTPFQAIKYKNGEYRKTVTDAIINGLYKNN